MVTGARQVVMLRRTISLLHRTIEDKDSVLEFTQDVMSKVAPSVSKAVVDAAQQTTTCMSDQPWDMSCQQKRNPELGESWGEFNVDDPGKVARRKPCTSPSADDSCANLMDRCSNVRSGFANGTLECQPSQVHQHLVLTVRSQCAVSGGRQNAVFLCLMGGPRIGQSAKSIGHEEDCSCSLLVQCCSLLHNCAALCMFP